MLRCNSSCCVDSTVPTLEIPAIGKPSVVRMLAICSDYTPEYPAWQIEFYGFSAAIPASHQRVGSALRSVIEFAYPTSGLSSVGEHSCRGLTAGKLFDLADCHLGDSVVTGSGRIYGTGPRIHPASRSQRKCHTIPPPADRRRSRRVRRSSAGGGFVCLNERRPGSRERDSCERFVRIRQDARRSIEPTARETSASGSGHTNTPRSKQSFACGVIVWHSPNSANIIWSESFALSDPI